jgi:hypothetical protein
MTVRTAFQVVLMIRLRHPERGDWLHFGDDLPGPEATGLDIGNGIQGGAFLRVVPRVDGRAIRASRPLP